MLPPDPGGLGAAVGLGAKLGGPELQQGGAGRHPERGGLHRTGKYSAAIMYYKTEKVLLIGPYVPKYVICLIILGEL